MITLLHIDASARTIIDATSRHASLTRQLSKAFVDQWLTDRPTDSLIRRDVGLTPPPAISETWIEAAFTPEAQRSVKQHQILHPSDTLIAEIDKADLILMGTPMYNYGMPAALKAWIDQVIRVGKTFSFDLARGDFPLKTIFTDKTLVIFASRGEFGFSPGEIREDMNHLETHIRTVSHYLGVTEDHLVAIDYQEFGDDRHRQSVVDAFARLPKLVTSIQNSLSDRVTL